MPTLTRASHVLAAALATARVTEVLALDQIAAPLRRRGGYVWTCVRCLSVWAGGATTLALLVAPWLNWPWALSWVYLALNDARRVRPRSARGPMLGRKDLDDRVAALLRDRAATREAVEQTQAAWQQQLQHLARIEGALLELQDMLKSPQLAEDAGPGAGAPGAPER